MCRRRFGKSRSRCLARSCVIKTHRCRSTPDLRMAARSSERHCSAQYAEQCGAQQRAALLRVLGGSVAQRLRQRTAEGIAGECEAAELHHLEMDEVCAGAEFRILRQPVPVAMHVHDGTFEGREYLENLGCSMGADVARDRDRVVIV